MYLGKPNPDDRNQVVVYVSLNTENGGFTSEVSEEYNLLYTGSNWAITYVGCCVSRETAENKYAPY